METEARMKKVIERYKKILALRDHAKTHPNVREIAKAQAAKLEHDYPGLQAMAAEGPRKGPKLPTPEEIVDLFPAWATKIADWLDVDIGDTVVDAMEWSIDSLALNDEELTAKFEDEVGLEVADGEDEDGTQYVVFAVEIPRRLWRRIARHRAVGMSFLAWLESQRAE